MEIEFEYNSTFNIKLLTFRISGIKKMYKRCQMKRFFDAVATYMQTFTKKYI